MLQEYYNELLNLDEIKLNFSESGLMIMNITIAFIMFGVALGIKINDFRNLIRFPKSIITGVVSQFILLPAVTFFIVITFNLPVSVSLGMLLVASCPGGNVSNFITSLAKGNVALSVSLTTIADISSIIITPLNFTFWGNMYLDTFTLENPIEIPLIGVLKTVMLLMGVPLIAGLWFSHKYPVITKKILKTVKIISVVAFFGFIIGAVISNFQYFIKYIWLIIPIVLFHNLIAFLLGYSASKIVRLQSYNTRTITIETGIQNSGIALVLIFNNQIFPEGYGGVAFIAATWGIWHIISGLILSTLWSRKKLKKQNFANN